MATVGASILLAGSNGLWCLALSLVMEGTNGLPLSVNICDCFRMMFGMVRQSDFCPSLVVVVNYSCLVVSDVLR